MSSSERSSATYSPSESDMVITRRMVEEGCSDDLDEAEA
jgi:hypothetical protein